MIKDLSVFFETEMMMTRKENALKGQHNLAQGKRSDALGLKAERKIVRAIICIKEEILFRTREKAFFFENDALQFPA